MCVFKNVPYWILDTGSGCDLTGAKDVAHARRCFVAAPQPVEFATAGGATTATHLCVASMPPLSEQIAPYVLKDTPCVLSVGLRCRKYGYSFHWPTRQKPYMVTPDEMIVRLEVMGDLPYLPLTAKPERPGQTKAKFPAWWHEHIAFQQDNRK